MGAAARARRVVYTNALAVAHVLAYGLTSVYTHRVYVLAIAHYVYAYVWCMQYVYAIRLCYTCMRARTRAQDVHAHVWCAGRCFDRCFGKA